MLKTIPKLIFDATTAASTTTTVITATTTSKKLTLTCYMICVLLPGKAI